MLHDLRRQLRQDQKTRADAVTADAVAVPLATPNPALPAPFAADAAPPLAADLAAELEAVRTSHPRLHASLIRLNPWQLHAVLARAPSLLVRAQVGSGKTAVLVHRVLVLHLVRGVPLRDLAVLTFTRKAAGEIRQRIEALAHDGVPLPATEFWLFGTFHGVARALLQRALPVERIGLTRRFTVLDASARDALWRRLIAEHTLDIKYTAQLDARMAALRQGRGLYGNMKRADDVQKLHDLARAEKIRVDSVDFDDLIDHATTLLPLERSPQHVLVDEFQDCEPRELALLRLLLGHGQAAPGAFFAVGDPYQSIYAWRGGSPQLFDAVQREFACEALTLPVNYRSTQAILTCARAVLGSQSDVVAHAGPLTGTRGAGDKVVVRRHHNPFVEALYLSEKIGQLRSQGASLRDIAVLFRTRRQAQPFADVFADRGIAYEEPARPALADRPAAAWWLLLLRATLADDLQLAREALIHAQFGCVTGRQWLAKSLVKHAARSGLTGLAALRAFLAEKTNRELEFAVTVIDRMLALPAALDQPVVDLAEFLWQHLELQLLLRPTTARHERDAADVRLVLSGLAAWVRAQGEPQLAGLRHALDDIALHGMGVLGEVADPQAESVKLLTLHAAKGLEFKHVFISGVNQGILPMARTYGDPAADAEERRLLFVGLTRARDTVEVGWHAQPAHPQALDMASSYLLAMPAILVEWLDGGTPAAAQATVVQTPVAALASPFQPGVRVRHPRYGEGSVTTADGESITCQFAKFGERSFPLQLCPLAIL